jgi:cytoskeletal protein RodZ
MSFYKFPFKPWAGVREVARLIMPTLGEELRYRREQRGISLAEISEATRIGTRFLKAIETDNFSILPGGIFTRSFIRAYAKQVGMDEDEAIALYLKQATGPGADQPDPPATEQSPSEQSTRRPATPKLVPKKAAPAPERSHRPEPLTYRASTSRTSWPTLVIGAGIVLFIAIIVIALVKQLNQGAGESESQSASAPINAPAKPPAQQSSQASSQASGGPDGTAPQPAAASSDAPSGQPLVVKVEAATGDAWIKYQIDDAKPTILLLKQGQSQDLPPAQTQITLNYGNRLTFKLKINNREATFPPDTPKFASQVVISRDNFQTYFQ